MLSTRLDYEFACVYVYLCGHVGVLMNFISIFYPYVVYRNTYTTINMSRNIIKHNIRASMNKRILVFIKMYLSHFILERVMFLVSER